MSGNVCQYIRCSNSKRRNPDLSFFSFPRRQHDRCTEWVRRCGNDSLLELSPNKFKGKVLCEEHFEAADIINQSPKKLIWSALPKMFETEIHNKEIQVHNDVATKNAEEGYDENQGVSSKHKQIKPRKRKPINQIESQKELSNKKRNIIYYLEIDRRYLESESTAFFV